MNVFIQFENSGDVLDCSQFTKEQLSMLWKEFLLWMFREDTSHPYWIYKDGEKVGCSFRGDAFAQWLNSHPSNSGNLPVRVLQAEAAFPPDEKMPILVL